MKDRVGDFLAGKGFYIVLFLCVAAIGISGYYLFSTMSWNESAVSTAATAKVTVTPAVRPTQAVRETTPASPSPTPAEEAAVKASPQAVEETPAAAQSSQAPASPAPTPTPAEAPTVFSWPLRGDILSTFSVETLTYDQTMGDWRTHAGIDIAAQLGTQVLSVAGGTVTAVDQDDLMGTTVVVDHGDGLTSCYANLAAVPVVEVGDTVAGGTVLGPVGPTAIAESAAPSHLHFAMAEDGTAVDPLDYLPQLS